MWNRDGNARLPAALGWFALFALTALAHPWDSTALIGLPVGFAATLALVSVPWRREWFPRRAVAPALSAVFTGFVVSGFFVEPPGADEVGAAVFVLVLVVAFLTGSLLWWRPWGRVRPEGPLREVRAMLDGDTTQWEHGQEIPRLLHVTVRARGYLTLLDCPPEQGPRTPADRTAAAGRADARGRVAVEIGGMLMPGSYPTDPTGLSTRRLSAALPDRHVWPDDLVTGWLVLEHRRLWVFGPPRMGDVLVGLPGQDVYAKAWLFPTGRAPDVDAEEPGVKVEAG